MNIFLFSIAFAFLKVSHQNPTSLWTMLPHILVAEVDGTVGQLQLSCLTPSEGPTDVDNGDQDIFWMKDGVKETQTGNTYAVELEESLGGGNYTCHRSDGSLLNHTMVLIKEDETQKRKILVTDDQGHYLRCWAQNFNGQFRCSWSWHSTRIGKVSFIKAHRAPDESASQCSSDASGKQWTCSSAQSTFICTVDESGHEIMCADKQYCPYAEESPRIFITIYVCTKHFLVENYSALFYLSEIVKPDKIRISKVNTTMIKWSYPSSWSSPFSYFPLTFQIAQLKRQCRKCNNLCTDPQATETLPAHVPAICQMEVKHTIRAICIRAKDALCDSQWSEWSLLRLGKDKKKKHQRNKNGV